MAQGAMMVILSLDVLNAPQRRLPTLNWYKRRITKSRYATGFESAGHQDGETVI